MRGANVTMAVAAFLFCAGAGEAQPGAESQAVVHCLSLVRGCQLPDGAFAQVAPKDGPDAPVWIAPYFANFAALALLTNADPAHRDGDLARVGRWLSWCAKHQSAEGYWNDFEGPASAYADTGKVDAWDSSAALFLLSAGRFRRAGGQLAPDVDAAVARARACLARVTDADGLTWAAPNHKVKYLMDNVEVRAGLRAMQTPETCAQAERMNRGLSRFWQASAHLYAYALHADGTFEGGLGKPYPQGLAQLFGVAFVSPEPSAWAAVTQSLKPETETAAACVAAWWLMAAERMEASDTRAWRERLLADAASFSSQQTYLQRPALTVLALTEGADWMEALRPTPGP